MISPQLDLGSPAGIWLDMPIKTEKNIAAGQRIKNLIKENAYSQKWVAFKLGYKSASTLSKQCSGENLPRGEELERMAALLHTTVDYILSGKSKDPFFLHAHVCCRKNSQTRRAKMVGLFYFLNSAIFPIVKACVNPKKL